MGHNVQVGVWKKGEMDAYLRTCAISKSAHEHIWHTCRPQLSAGGERAVTLLVDHGINFNSVGGDTGDADDGEIGGDYALITN